MAEEPAFPFAEEVVAPVERPTQRLLPLGQVPGTPAQEVEPLPEAREDHGRLQETHPGGGQLDRERQAVQPRADPGNGYPILVVEPEFRVRGPGPLHEQVDRAVPEEIRHASLRFRIGHSQRGHRKDPLPTELEDGSAGNQDLDFFGLLEQIRDALRRGEDSLETVEHEQTAAPVETGAEFLSHIGPGLDLDSDRPRDRDAD